TLNSAAVARPELITEIAERFGSQAVVLAIDARRKPSETGAPFKPSVGLSGVVAEVFVAGGRKPTGLNAVTWAKEVESRGAGELMLTSMDRDGTRAGFDCELTSVVASAVSIPVIASGGAGNAEHFTDVFGQGCADAALAASIFHFGIHDVRELK